MRFRHIALLLSLGAYSTLHAATEFEDGLVPLDLARFIAGSGELYRSLPDGFPVVLPATSIDVGVVGSVEYLSSQQVLLRSEQGGQALLDALRSAYVGAGWLELERVAGYSTLLCHDEHGKLQFTTTDVGSKLLAAYRTQGSMLSCARQQQQGSGGEDQYSYLLNQFPVLSAPPQTSAAHIYFSETGFVTRDASIELQRDAALVVPQTNVAAVHAHFAARLTAQGWTSDSYSEAATSANSVWYKTAPPPSYAPDAENSRLTGILLLLHNGGDNYRAQFELHGVVAPSSCNNFAVSGRGVPPPPRPAPPPNLPSAASSGVRPLLSAALMSAPCSTR